MPRARLALLAALVSTALASPHAGAATKPLLTDPKGDAIALGNSWDIVSADLVTTGTTKKVGRKSVYTPTVLLASVTLAGPPSTQVGTKVHFRTDISACGGGYIDWSYLPGTKAGHNNGFVVGCGDPLVNGQLSERVGDNAVVKGNTITWKLRLKEMGKDLPLGTTFRKPVVSTDVNDPYFGLFGTGTLAPTTSFDDAKSSNTYELH